jgi:hypothetical protein
MALYLQMHSSVDLLLPRTYMLGNGEKGTAAARCDCGQQANAGWLSSALNEKANEVK